MALPTNDARRKKVRAFQGFVSYFPDAVALVAYLSKVANEQHNPGEPMHWAKEKSTEELDSLMNHAIDIASKGELSQDADGVLDAIKVAWRGMANLQRLADKHGMDLLFDLMEGIGGPTPAKSKGGDGYVECRTKDCQTYVPYPRVRCTKCIEEYNKNLDAIL